MTQPTTDKPRRDRRPNREMVDQIAAAIRCHTHVHDVFVYGSVARDGFGNDIDLIITTDRARANKYIASAAKIIRHHNNGGRKNPCDSYDWTYYHVGLLIESLDKTLGKGFYIVRRNAEKLAHPAKIDLLLFPDDWRKRIQELQQTMMHSDPKFMENIACDAILV